MDKEFKHKLYHYEAQPPQKIWQSIEEILNAPVPLQERLHRFEEAPPKQVWSRITAALDKAGHNQKLPHHSAKRYFIFKYVAAAALLLFLSLSIVWIINKSSEKGITVQNAPHQAQDSGAPQQAPSHLYPAEQTNNELQQNASVVDNAGNKRPFEEETLRYNQAPKTSFIKQMNTKSALKPSVDAPKEAIIVQNDKEDKYMIYSTASGSVVKLPKKLYTLFSCATDPDISQAYWCKQNIQSLQQKVAQSSSPSTDFAAMLYIIKDLQENQ